MHGGCTNLPFELPGRAVDWAPFTEGQTRPHLGLYPGPLDPLLVLAIGRGAEVIRRVEISETESHAYYRKDGVHYVPKVRLSDLILG